MQYLVTGGAGFIGSHVCEYLLEQGHAVTCLDNFNDYYDPAVKHDNISDAEEHDRFTLIEGDIREFSKELDVDCVIHLAAQAGVRYSIEEPEHYYDVNVNGTINMLDWAVENGVDNFIFGSSSSVYGTCDSVPFSEDDKGTTISPYASSKQTCEYLCSAWHEQFQLNVNCLRFFTVYGPRNRPDMAVYLFTDLISRGEPITMYGDGTSKRDYTYVQDIAAGVYNASLHNEGFDIYNLGNNETVELQRLIATIEEAVGKEAEIEQEPMPPGDVPLTYADISKAKQELDYDPSTSIDEGIPKVVEWYEEVHG